MSNIVRTVLLMLISVGITPTNSESSMRMYLYASEWPSHDIEKAVEVARCETGGTFDPLSVGDDGDALGLFQIHWDYGFDDVSKETEAKYWMGWHWWAYHNVPSYDGESDPFNPVDNALLAKEIVKFKGWYPWTCAKSITKE